MPCRPKGSLWLPFGAFGARLAAVVVLATGCAEVTGNAVEQDVAQLRQDVNAVTLALHRSRGDTEAVLGQIDRRNREQATESSRQLAQMATRFDGLAAELARTSARVEELASRVDVLSRQVSSRPVPGGPSPVPQTGGGAAPRPAPTAGGPAPEQAYQAAYLDFTKGNYPLAIQGFREFGRRYPDATLADEAQYWVGEAYFSMARASAAKGDTERATRELEQAVQEFRRVVLNHPRGDRVPTAIYKEALALIDLKQPRLAQSRLQYLIDHFPQSEEAPLARERLAGGG